MEDAKHKRVTLGINGRNITVELNHTYEEWEAEMSDISCWDFCIDDFISGAIEPDENIVFWLIDNRFYEAGYVG